MLDHHRKLLVLFGMSSLLFISSVSRADSSFQPAQHMPLATSSLVLDLEKTGSQMIAVGERGHILRSQNCGSSWQQAKVPVRVLLTAVHFQDALQGWAVGHDSVILGTRDGGKIWQRLYSNRQAEQPLLDIWFQDPQQGIAIGAYGAYLETRDGGKSWKKRTISEDDFHLYSFTRLSGDAWFMVGESGSVYRSNDQGENWRRLNVPYAGTFFGSLAASDRRLLIFGMRGSLYYTDDLGETWTQVETGTVAALEKGARLDDGTIELVGHSGLRLRSLDQGSHFTTVNSIGRRHLSAIEQCNSGQVIIAGEHGFLKLKK